MDIRNKRIINTMSNKDNVKEDLKKIYRYTDRGSINTKVPQLNAVYNDGKVYRKENYGVFVKFDNNNFNGLLHKSKLGGKYLDSINIGDIISVSIIEIKGDMRISLRLFQQEFPDLNNSKKKSVPTVNSRWNSNLSKIMKPSNEVLKRQDINKRVRCKYSGNLIYEKDSYKCKESTDGEIYYFESLYNALRYNKLKNRYMKLLLDDGSLEILQWSNYKDRNLDEVDVL